MSAIVLSRDASHCWNGVSCEVCTSVAVDSPAPSSWLDCIFLIPPYFLFGYISVAESVHDEQLLPIFLIYYFYCEDIYKIIIRDGGKACGER